MVRVDVGAPDCSEGRAVNLDLRSLERAQHTLLMYIYLGSERWVAYYRIREKRGGEAAPSQERKAHQWFGVSWARPLVRF